jgi:hypothetical protein
MLRHALNPSVHIMVELVLLHGETASVVVVDAIQALMCFEDFSSVFMKETI